MSGTDSLETPLGNELGPVEFEITQDMVRRWAEVTDDQTLLASEGEVFLPPALLFGLVLLLRQEIVEARAAQGDDAVQSTYDLQTNRPIRVGEKLQANGKLVRRYIKREREYYVWEIRFRDEAGLEVAHYQQENLETYKKVS